MKTVLLTFIALLFLLVLSDTTYAQSGTFIQPKGIAKNTSTLKVYSAQQAAKLVKRRIGGKILKVNKHTVNGSSGYRVKLIKKNGHIVSVLVDAKSGRVMGG
jgi:uncharacterized membrane protein YkoI